MEAFAILRQTQQEFLRQFFEHAVAYVVVGGYAVRYHGCLRPTDDLDVFVDRSPENIDRFCKAMTALRTTLTESHRLDLLKPCKKLVWPDHDPDVECLTSMEGVEFPDVWQTRLELSYQGIIIPIISRELLIQSKKAAISDPDHLEKKTTDEQDLHQLTRFRGLADNSPIPGSTSDIE